MDNDYKKNGFSEYARAVVPAAFVVTIVLTAIGLPIVLWNTFELRALRDKMSAENARVLQQMEAGLARQGMIYDWLLKEHEDRAVQGATKVTH